MKSVFKVGDKVFHIEYGWGTVRFQESINFPLLVEFNEDEVMSFNLDGRETTESKQPLLSFTEYTLQGFTQERPVELPEVGELCVVRDEEGDEWELCYFISYKSDAVTYKFETSFGYYKQMKRIKILD